MKITANIRLNLKTEEIKRTTVKAAENAFRDTVAEITRDVIEGSPKRTGNNARSISFSIDGLHGSVQSTSGYGGFLETGTYKMPPRPYFRPALDKEFTIDKFAERVRSYLP